MLRVLCWKSVRALASALLVPIGIVLCVSQAAAAEAAKPIFTVTLQHGEILAGNVVDVWVVVENPTEHRVANIILRYSGPTFLKIGTVVASRTGTARCDVAPAGMVLFGELPPLSAFTAPKQLCLRADPTVEERELTAVFSLGYEIAERTGTRTGVLTSEKKLNVGLIGTDTVGGVSLRLVSYLVPGLLFLMILRLGGFPMIDKLSTTEQAIASVFISVVLSYFLSWIGAIQQWPFITGGSGVNLTLFVLTALAAVSTAAVLVVVYKCCAAIAAARQAERTVQIMDNQDVVLRKALLTADGDLSPVVVLAADQTRYIGSLTAPTQNGGIALVGWFEFRLAPAEAQLRIQLQNLLNGAQYVEALNLARDHNPPIRPELRNPIAIRRPNGDQVLDQPVRRFDPETYAYSKGAIPGVGDPPLMLAAP